DHERDPRKVRARHAHGFRREQGRRRLEQRPDARAPTSRERRSRRRMGRPRRMIPRSLVSPRFALLVVAIAPLALACRTEGAPQAAPSASAASPPAVPVDRLAPGELAPGTVDVFGFPVPRELEVVSRTRDAALLIGQASPDAVSR